MHPTIDPLRLRRPGWQATGATREGRHNAVTARNTYGRNFSIDPGPSEAPAGTVGGMTMAQVDTWEGGSNATYLDFFYNVTMAVGPVGTAPNRRDDVLLVQYFLTKIAGSGIWVPTQTAKPFQVDGRMGSDTAAWIKSYQNSKKTLVFQDGRIDRALGANSSISRTMYTILFLNDDFQTAVLLKGQLKKFEALEDDIEAPIELRTAIRLSRARGATGLPWDSPGH